MVATRCENGAFRLDPRPSTLAALGQGRLDRNLYIVAQCIGHWATLLALAGRILEPSLVKTGDRAPHLKRHRGDLETALDRGEDACRRDI